MHEQLREQMREALLYVISDEEVTDETIAAILPIVSAAIADAKALNLAAVLAALDDILSDWTLHPRAEASAMKVRLRKLRAHIAEYRTPKEPNND